MSTPRRNNQCYDSPYAKSVQQYPSQSEDFLSLEANKTPKQGPQQQHQRSFSTPGKYFNQNFHQRHRGQHQQHFGGIHSTPQRGNSWNEGGDVQFNQNHQQRRGQQRWGGDGGGHTPYGQQQNHRWGGSGRGGGRGRGGGQQKFTKMENPKNSQFDFPLYFHPTMLEDPWRDLMERHNAIRRSEIDMKADIASQEQSKSSVEDQSEDEGGDNEQNATNTASRVNLT